MAAASLYIDSIQASSWQFWQKEKRSHRGKLDLIHNESVYASDGCWNIFLLDHGMHLTQERSASPFCYVIISKSIRELKESHYACKQRTPLCRNKRQLGRDERLVSV